MTGRGKPIVSICQEAGFAIAPPYHWVASKFAEEEFPLGAQRGCDVTVVGVDRLGRRLSAIPIATLFVPYRHTFGVHAMSNKKLALILAAGAALLAGCETTSLKMGSEDAKTVATGSAAGSASTDANSQLERCASPLGTVSLVENESAGWYTILRNEYRLPPTSNLLRLMIQQSNCFVVVERGGAGMRAMSRERELMQSGEMRGGSNFGRGQLVASDYGLSPEIIFSEGNTGGLGAALGGLIGGAGGNLFGAVAAGTRTREASTMLTLVDNRSGVQVSASEGSASKTDFGGFGSLFGGRAGGGLGGYQNTPQGKVITAAFMDAYNQMVRSLRNYRAQRVQGQGLGGGGRLGVDGGASPSQTYTPQNAPRRSTSTRRRR